MLINSRSQKCMQYANMTKSDYPRKTIINIFLKWVKIINKSIYNYIKILIK